MLALSWNKEELKVNCSLHSGSKMATALVVVSCVAWPTVSFSKEDAIQRLIRTATDSGDREQRQKALKELAALGDSAHSAASSLVDKMLVVDRDERLGYFTTLKAIGNVSVVECNKVLQGGGDHDRLVAMECLSWIYGRSGKDFEELILKGLSNSSCAVRESSLFALHQASLDPPRKLITRAISDLESIAFDAKCPPILRRSAVSLLSRCEEEVTEVIPTLDRVWRNRKNDLDVRISALQGLSNRGRANKNISGLLRGAMNDLAEHPFVRVVAATELEKTANLRPSISELCKVAQAFYSDPAVTNYGFRSAIIGMFFRHPAPTKEAIPAMLKSMEWNDEGPCECDMALAVLAKIGPDAKVALPSLTRKFHREV